VSDAVTALHCLAAEARAKGHESMILSVSRPLKRPHKRPSKRRQEERVRIAPGLYGRWVGDIQEPGVDGHVVDVSVADVDAWLRRQDMTADSARLAKLEAENAQLREYIAAAKECAEAGALTALQEENDRLRAAFQEIIDNLSAGKAVQSGHCQWCGEVWPIVEAETFEQARQHAAAHANKCTANPIRIERDALRHALIRVADAQVKHRSEILEVWAARAVANDMRAPFSEERVQERLAVYLEEEPAP
jgi:hypothetical protein